MIRGFFAGCVGAFWLQFCRNLAVKAAANQPTPPPLVDATTAADKARIEQILARCEADRACRGVHSPDVFARWIDIAIEHDVDILIADRDRAVAVHSPAQRRVH